MKCVDKIMKRAWRDFNKLPGAGDGAMSKYHRVCGCDIEARRASAENENCPIHMAQELNATRAALDESRREVERLTRAVNEAEPERKALITALRSKQDAPATEAKPCRDCVEWQKRGAKTCVRHSAEPSRKED